MSKKFVYSLAIAASLALPLAGSASAATFENPFGAAGASTQLAPIENAQFFLAGRNYCWYDNGWEGPGFYWCGYELRQGMGWGGGEGWNGWQRGGHGMGSGAQRGPGGVHPTPGAQAVAPSSPNVVRPGGASRTGEGSLVRTGNGGHIGGGGGGGGHIGGGGGGGHGGGGGGGGGGHGGGPLPVR